MSGIRGRDTTPERLVRSYLHRKGLRFRLHDRRLPGRPDIVLARFQTTVLVHGCSGTGIGVQACVHTQVKQDILAAQVSRYRRAGY